MVIWMMQVSTIFNIVFYISIPFQKHYKTVKLKTHAVFSVKK